MNAPGCCTTARANAGSRPIRGGYGINPGRATLNNAADKFMHKMRMRAMMSAALLE